MGIAEAVRIQGPAAVFFCCFLVLAPSNLG
jgi:hypothetical protein